MNTYFEQRTTSGSGGTDSIAADMMRHLYTRQYLGKTVVVCELPVTMVSAARKQWLKLARSLQRQRSSTLNADKILKYTHGIAHMQRLRFSSKTSLEQPNADAFFLPPESLQTLPAQCLNIYIAVKITEHQVKQLLEQVAPDALIVDYSQAKIWKTHNLIPRKQLEAQVGEEWRQVRHFLNEYGITMSNLHKNEVHSVEAMDDALDVLLSVSHRFLSVAGAFQHALELARPMRMSKALREKYDSFILLAHRVQALTPGAFSQQFLQVYNEDDTFFLYDHSQDLLVAFGGTFQETHARHIQAGRKHLAQALAHHFYSGRSFQPAR